MSNKGDKPGELLQIVILTLGMTGGGFLLLYLVMVLFMIPSATTAAENAEARNAELTKELLKQDIKELRRDSKIQEEAGEQKGLEEIIPDMLGRWGVERDRLVPASREGQTGWNVTTKPAPLRSLLSFAVAVREAKKTVQVESLKVSRGRRRGGAGGPEDAWVADIVFLDYGS